MSLVGNLSWQNFVGILPAEVFFLLLAHRFSTCITQKVQVVRRVLYEFRVETSTILCKAYVDV